MPAHSTRRLADADFVLDTRSVGRRPGSMRDVRRTALLGQAASRLESRIREHVNLLRAAAA